MDRDSSLDDLAKSGRRSGSFCMRQHIDSFNHFTNVDIKQIVAARSKQEIRNASSSCDIQIFKWASLT